MDDLCTMVHSGESSAVSSFDEADLDLEEDLKWIDRENGKISSMMPLLAVAVYHTDPFHAFFALPS